MIINNIDIQLNKQLSDIGINAATEDIKEGNNRNLKFIFANHTNQAHQAIIKYSYDIKLYAAAYGK